MKQHECILEAKLPKLPANTYSYCKLWHRNFVANKKSGVTFLKRLTYPPSPAGISVVGYLVKLTQKISDTKCLHLIFHA